MFSRIDFDQVMMRHNYIVAIEPICLEMIHHQGLVQIHYHIIIGDYYLTHAVNGLLGLLLITNASPQEPSL